METADPARSFSPGTDPAPPVPPVTDQALPVPPVTAKAPKNPTAKKRKYKEVIEDDSSDSDSDGPVYQGGSVQPKSKPLNWKKVRALGSQLPVPEDCEKDFPVPFDPDYEVPDNQLHCFRDRTHMSSSDNDHHLLTHWALDRIKLASKGAPVLGTMMEDPAVKIKWNLSPKKTYNSQKGHLAYKQIGLVPLSNLEAMYAAMCGVVLPKELWCVSCAKKNGPIRGCIVLDGYLNGACANCHYGNGGSKCSHRPDSKVRIKTAGQSQNTSRNSSNHSGSSSPSHAHSSQVPSPREIRRVLEYFMAEYGL